MNDLFNLVLAWMLHFAPIDRAPQLPGYEETREQTMARYHGIAHAIAAVCIDRPGPRSCAALLVAIGIGESGFARDADIGPCYRGKGHETRCDRGKAASSWQAQAYGKDWDGASITVPRLFAERRLAAWVVIRQARWSLANCKHLAPEDRLSALSGKCQAGLLAAQAHYHRWNRIAAWMPPKEKP